MRTALWRKNLKILTLSDLTWLPHHLMVRGTCVSDSGPPKGAAAKKRRPTPANTREGHVTSRCIKPRPKLISLSSTARPGTLWVRDAGGKKGERTKCSSLSILTCCYVSPALPHRGRAAAVSCGGLPMQQKSPMCRCATVQDDRENGRRQNRRRGHYL